MEKLELQLEFVDFLEVELIKYGHCLCNFDVPVGYYKFITISYKYIRNACLKLKM